MLKKTNYLFLLCCACFFMLTGFCGEGNGNAAMAQSQDEVFFMAEEMPSFPGGTKELKKYIHKKLRYPEEALQNNYSGRVIVSFIVEKDGSLSGLKIGKRVKKCLDDEALRIFKGMPKWSPGKKGGQAVRVKMNFPIYFKLAS